MKDAQLNLTFSHQYEVEIKVELPSIPGRIKQIYYPGATEKGGQGGVIVKIIPEENPPWIGIFASGYPKALTGIFSCPDKEALIVVSGGKGYIVRPDNPKDWEEILSYPIMDVRPILDKQLLVFTDFTTLTAYGSEGLVWTTDRLSWDGLKITEISLKHIKGLAWDAPQAKEIEFIVDIETGEHKGGSSPEKYMSHKKLN